jgi:5-methylcytosine-specific restriction endonuclease McrA
MEKVWIWKNRAIKKQCDDCLYSLTESKSTDELKNLNYLIGQRDKAIKRLENEKNLFDINQLEKEAFNEGYSEGFKEGYKAMFEKKCYRCDGEANSLHHVIPREHGGKDNVENLLFLCKECHDEIEIYTSELLEIDDSFGTEQLKNFIKNSNFPQERRF